LRLSRSAPPEAGSGFTTGGDAERTGLEQVDLAGLHIAAAADAAPIDGADVLHAGRQPGAMLAVPEDDRRLVLVVGLGLEAAVIGSEPGERRRLMPAHVVDIDGERALRARRGRGRGEGERRLLQREALQRLAAVATAEQLLASLAMGRAHDIAVDDQRGALVAVGGRRREAQRRVRAVAGKRRIIVVDDARQHHQLAGVNAAHPFDVAAFAGEDDEAAGLQLLVEAVELDLLAVHIVRDRLVRERQLFARRMDERRAQHAHVELRPGVPPVEIEG
jgi:hypothetical protein